MRSYENRDIGSEAGHKSAFTSTRHDGPQPRITEVVSTRRDTAEQPPFVPLPVDSAPKWQTQPRLQHTGQDESGEKPARMPTWRDFTDPLGNGEWVDDDVPDPSPQTYITDREIVVATEPAIIFADTAVRFQHNVSVDLDAISERLAVWNFPEETHDSFAVVVQDADVVQVGENYDRQAWYASSGFLDVGEDVSTRYPLAVNVVYPKSEGSINFSVAHEFYHAYRDKVDRIGDVSLYHSRENLDRVRKIGVGTIAAGSLIEAGAAYTAMTETGSPTLTIAGIGGGIIVAGAGVLAASLPKEILSRLDKEERAANRFARQNRDFRPITIKK